MHEQFSLTRCLRMRAPAGFSLSLAGGGKVNTESVKKPELLYHTLFISHRLH